MTQKRYKWVAIYVKREYSRYGIPEMIGIYYNPYLLSNQDVINFWIEPEYRKEVYAVKG